MIYSEAAKLFLNLSIASTKGFFVIRSNILGITNAV